MSLFHHVKKFGIIIKEPEYFEILRAKGIVGLVSDLIWAKKWNLQLISHHFGPDLLGFIS